MFNIPCFFPSIFFLKKSSFLVINGMGDIQTNSGVGHSTHASHDWVWVLQVYNVCSQLAPVSPHCTFHATLNSDGGEVIVVRIFLQGQREGI